MAVICAVSDKPTSDIEVRRTSHAIREVGNVEGTKASPNTAEKSKTVQTGQTSLKGLSTGGRSQNFRRVTLGVVIQCFQQVLVHYGMKSDMQLMSFLVITYYAVSE
jgi:hypothetical protein